MIKTWQQMVIMWLSSNVDLGSEVYIKFRIPARRKQRWKLRRNIVDAETEKNYLAFYN